KAPRGGRAVSPASSLNGDAHVGRLGNEKDNYAELSFGKKAPRGGRAVSPASSLNGDAHVGRLGNEKDNYA
ncbi:hypothetical protein C9I60_28800, partial [Klebsiella pneumoniae]